jgi:serine/threonine-protein kinase
VSATDSGYYLPPTESQPPKKTGADEAKRRSSPQAEALAKALAAHGSGAQTVVPDDAKPATPASAPPAPSPHDSGLSAAAAALKSGARARKLGRYELVRRLGEGAMATVFEARDERNGRTVALKVLPRKLAGDAEFVERFQREAAALASLSHPNITAVYESDAAGGWFFYAMEYVPGDSLVTRLERLGRFSESESLHITAQIASALAHAHRRNIIHRDVKPDNVLMTSGDTVKLSDFGLAKLLQADSKLTAAGIAVGTPHYLSPEQAVGSKDIDHRCDLYGLGVTLFHMLTGRLPFDAATAMEVMTMHVHVAPPDPRQFVPTISRSAARLTLRLMSKRPQDRPINGEEVLAAIQAIQRGETDVPAAAAISPAVETSNAGRCRNFFRRLRDWFRDLSL